MKRLSHRLRRPLIHRNQRRLSAHIPRLHPLLPRAARLVRAAATVFEPLVLASSEIVGYRPFSHRGRTIYYCVDNLNLLSNPATGRAPGLLLYFDGDHISRAGSRLLRRTSPLTYNWWVRARSNGRMVRALIEEISLAYGVDMSRVWLAGYSGGAEFLSYELLSHDIDWLHGGGATFIGGGGADGIPARVRERAALSPSSHEHLLMSWHVGVLDGRSPSARRRMATSTEGSWSARIAAQEGIAFYEGLGARTLLQVTPGRGHTGYPIASLVGADLATATRLGFL